MSKKEQTAQAATSLEGFQPQKMTNAEEFFQGFEVVNPIQLEEGQCFTLPFLGFGGNIAMQRASGDGIDYVGSWRFEYGLGIVRIMGSTVLDRELRSIEARYVMPVIVKIWREGEKDIGHGHTLNLYKVGVDIKGIQKPLKEDQDGKELPF